MTQGDFFDGYDIREGDESFTRMHELDEAFRDFHRDNPEVWRLFVRFTFDVIRRGYAHYSADAILHRIRWHATVDTDGDEFKLNNNWTALYARMFHDAYPEHAGFFRTRERISKRRRA